MATFPSKENDILSLANNISNGLAAHAEDFPNIDSIEFNISVAEYTSSKSGAEDAKSASMIATASKQDALDGLVEKMKTVLKQAEVDCAANPEKLTEIGWSGRKTPTPLALPGQPTELVPVYEGPGILTLKWNRPKTGGAVSSFRIERSDQPEGGGVPGPWTLVNTYYTNQVTLENQPRSIEMQYRVIATNAAGDSLASNIATVVL